VSSFPLQGAADPEHPKKHPGTPHPVRVDLYNFEKLEGEKLEELQLVRAKEL
jgi:hypothetical protein